VRVSLFSGRAGVNVFCNAVGPQQTADGTHQRQGADEFKRGAGKEIKFCEAQGHPKLERKNRITPDFNMTASFRIPKLTGELEQRNTPLEALNVDNSQGLMIVRIIDLLNSYLYL